MMGRRRLSEDCQGVGLILNAGGCEGAVGPSVVWWVGVSQDRFSSSVCSILTMCGADGVSFVESLPQQFVVGKTGLVLVAVQGALLERPYFERRNSSGATCDGCDYLQEVDHVFRIL